MTTPSIAAPFPARMIGRSLRLLLAAVGVLILITVAFVVGRFTVNSTPNPVTAPAVSSPLPASAGVCQHVGHFQSAGC